MRFARFVLPFLLLAVCTASAAEGTDVNDMKKEGLAPFTAHLKEKGLAPVPYLVKSFEKGEVVFLGETHWVRENCRLVSDAVGPLYREAGVRRLATEFLRSRHNDKINAIVTAAEYDEAAVIALMRDGPWPIWGFREYEAIYKSIWKLNKSLPKGAEPFLLIGLDSEWSQYALWFETPDKMDQFKTRMAREKHMIKTLDEQAFAKNLKTLVHVGAAHALVCHGERLATVLYKKYPDRIFQIHLHSNVPAGRSRSRLTRMIEALHKLNGGTPVGFDVLGTPFAPLRDRNAIWWRFLPKGTFSDFAQGYIVLAPLDGLHQVTWIDGFVTAESFAHAEKVCVKYRWAEAGAAQNAEDLNAVLAGRFAGKLISESK